MKKKEPIEKVIQDELLIEISCDFCGKTITREDILMEDITEFTIEPGYGSKFDLEVFKFDICDNCLEEVILSKVKK